MWALETLEHYCIEHEPYANMLQPLLMVWRLGTVARQQLLPVNGVGDAVIMQMGAYEDAIACMLPGNPVVAVIVVPMLCNHFYCIDIALCRESTMTTSWMRM